MTLRDDIIRELLYAIEDDDEFSKTADRILDLIRQQRQFIRAAIIQGWWSGNDRNASYSAADAVIELLCGDDGKAETIRQAAADRVTRIHKEAGLDD